MSKFTLIKDNNAIVEIDLNFKGFRSKHDKRVLQPIDDENKECYVQELLSVFEKGDMAVLFDPSMVNTAQKASQMADEMSGALEGAALFFTSGTSGNPTGVLKRREHIEEEVLSHIRWLSGMKFEQCLVCVPFFHIYGFLFGVALPLEMGLDIVTQDHFLPGDIIAQVRKKPTLCIANPVFIRALNRLRESHDFSDSLFISSAGALEPSEAEIFEERYNTTLVQLYGSTETGGIAIRKGSETLWSPLEGVEVSLNDSRLCIKSPFVSEVVIQEDLVMLSSPYQTTDIVRLEGDRFEIIGRESELIKIGGKRLSVVEIEHYLESLEGIDEVLVTFEYRPGMLRGEKMHLSAVGTHASLDAAKIKKLLHDRFGGIHIECSIDWVESIPKTSTGKKIRVPLTLVSS